MICAENCAIFLLHQYGDDNDDDLCEGRGNCRLSAEPRVVDIPRPEQHIIIIVLASLGPGRPKLDHQFQIGPKGPTGPNGSK